MSACYEKNPGNAGNSGGFTLVELQIALLLMAMITMLMVGALRITIQTWDKSTAKQDGAEHRYLTDQFLRKHLNNMRFVRSRTTQGTIISGFLGDSQQLHFVAPFPAFDNDGSLFWWTLKSQRDAKSNRDQLVLEYYPFSPGQPVDYESGRGIRLDDLEPTPLTVADATRIVSVEYYYQDAEGLELRVDDWEPGTYAPKLIRLKLAETDPDGDEVELLELAVAPRFALQQLLFQPGD